MKQLSLLLLVTLLLLPACQQPEPPEPETAQPFYLASITGGGFFGIRSKLVLMDAEGNLRDYNTVEEFRFWEREEGDFKVSTGEDLRYNLSLEVPAYKTLSENKLQKMLDRMPEDRIQVLPEEDANACCDLTSTSYFALVKRPNEDVYDWVFLGSRILLYGYLSRPEEGPYRKLLKLMVEEFEE